MSSKFSTRIAVCLALIVCITIKLQTYVLADHQWKSTVTSLRYLVNANSQYLPAADVIATIRLMASTWNAHSKVQLVYGGTTKINGTIFDGSNVLYFSPEIVGSLSAQAQWWWGGDQSLFDVDIAFFENAYHYSIGSGCTDGVYLENTVVHEFGHMLGLNHSAVPTATMYAVVSRCDLTRTSLDPDDLDGLREMQKNVLLPQLNALPFPRFTRAADGR